MIGEGEDLRPAGDQLAPLDLRRFIVDDWLYVGKRLKKAWLWASSGLMRVSWS